MLDHDLAARFTDLALANVSTEYPYKLDQTLSSDADVRAPRVLHPMFYGSYDWHSCVHMHWTLARLLRLFPHHKQSEQARAHFDRRLTAANTVRESATLQRPTGTAFERPYGWGWLLKLSAELHLLATDDVRAEVWRDSLAPLAKIFADRWLSFLPKVDYANRSGTHGNTAFALLLTLDYCDVAGNDSLKRLIHKRARDWFGQDSSYPADYEPGGDDFLSAGLVEAALMHRLLDTPMFLAWWSQFRPVPRSLAAWMRPVEISDPGDPKIVHLHGLNLSRAWCWQRLLPALQPAPDVEQAISEHLAKSLHAASGGDYVGTHWLASFALLALTTAST